MPDDHLQPNRGWTLVRDAGKFTPAELSHLKDCQECTDWLRLFADLALNAGIKLDVHASIILGVDEHLEPERGLALICEGGNLRPAEQGHLLRCCECNAWLSGLADLARRVGLTIEFEVPPWDRFD